jgi:DNA-binding XRE family transcriptional regulator
VTEKEKGNFYSIIGNNIRAIRETKLVKQSTLAEMLNLSRASIVNIEKGRQHPSLHLLVEIARSLDTEFEKLLNNLDINPTKPSIKEGHSVKFGDRYNSKSQREAEKHVKKFLSTITNLSNDDSQKD